MGERPLSDRKHRDQTVSGPCWEVRAWEPPPPRTPDERGWRTLAWSPNHDDAVVLARALVDGSDHPFEYVEVWGPAEAAGGRSHTCERFPEPTPEERREIWMRAATTHYSDGLDLIKGHTTVS